jgi:hypothetical protein
MRSFFVRFIGVLLLAAACSSSSSDQGGAEIRSEQDVKRFFDAVMPELVAAFTELANQLSAPPAALSVKGGGVPTVTVECPEGGSLGINPNTGEATLTDCGAAGVVINSTLFLFVQPIPPSSYQAQFSGLLMVSGSFNGTVEIIQAFVQWTDPASVETTFWEVTVLAGEEMVTVTSAEIATGTACTWDRSGQANEVRVQVFNSSDLPGVFVELTAGGVTCAIEDENRMLQLPTFGNTFPDNRNTVSAGDTFGGLGQALIPIGENDVVMITAQYQGRTTNFSCTVSAEAFNTGTPGATAGQAFFDVFAPFGGTCPPTISCSSGFVFANSDTTIRPGPACSPDTPFTCDSECFEVCVEGEQFSFAECGPENVCQCNCVTTCGF